MDHPAQPLFPIPPEPALRTCGECGRSVRVDESIILSGVVVCASCKPTVLAKLQTGQQIGEGGVWRDKQTIVMGPRAVLPDRCVKCNAVTPGPKLKRQLYWHPAWVYATILLNLLIYLVVALIVRKRATVEVALCPQHRQSRWIHIAIAWTLVLGGGAGIVLGANDQDLAILIGLGILAILAGIVWGVVGARIVFARRIDPQWVKLGGAGRPFLASLPEFPKQA